MTEQREIGFGAIHDRRKREAAEDDVVAAAGVSKDNDPGRNAGDSASVESRGTTEAEKSEISQRFEDIRKTNLPKVQKRIDELKEKGNWSQIAREYALLQEAGVRLKGNVRDKEHNILRDKIQDYADDPRRLAFYLTCLKQIGAVEGDDGKSIVENHKEKLLSYYKEELKKPAKDRKTLAFAVSLKELGIQDDFSGDIQEIREEVLNTLDNVRAEADAVLAGRTFAILQARLRKLGLPSSLITQFRLSYSEVREKVGEGIRQAQQEKRFDDMAAIIRFGVGEQKEKVKKALGVQKQMMLQQLEELGQENKMGEFISFSADINQLRKKGILEDTAESSSPVVEEKEEHILLGDNESTDPSLTDTNIGMENGGDTVIEGYQNEIARVQNALKQVEKQLLSGERFLKEDEEKNRLELSRKVLQAELALLQSGDAEKIKNLADARESGKIYLGIAPGDILYSKSKTIRQVIDIERVKGVGYILICNRFDQDGNKKIDKLLASQLVVNQDKVDRVDKLGGVLVKKWVNDVLQEVDVKDEEWKKWAGEYDDEQRRKRRGLAPLEQLNGDKDYSDVGSVRIARRKRKRAEEIRKRKKEPKKASKKTRK